MFAKKRVRYRLFFCLFFLALALGGVGAGYIHYYNQLPENIHLNLNSRKSIEFGWPLTGEITSRNVKGINYENNLKFSGAFPLLTSATGSYMLEVKFLGIFHLKDIRVNVMDETQLIPCGLPAGIYLETEGLLVVDTVSFTSREGITVNPCGSILRKGDYILGINGERVVSKEQFMRLLEDGPDEVILEILRGEERFQVKILPQRDMSGALRLGVWIKDDAQGIGTVTYVGARGNFGALGHGISDTDVGKIIAIKKGRIYHTSILSIKKGTAGAPGEYIGTIDYNPVHVIGAIEKNTPLGIYGSVQEKYLEELGGFSLCAPVFAGYKEEIRKGRAQIQTYCDGELKRFDIEIEEIDLGNQSNKGITFKVTDNELLSKTNGIVQGMSGSPILQGGKLIGAVTHVFVNDPSRGYGIFIENMLAQ